MTGIDLAVVIVTWNVRDMALDALRTLYADLARTPWWRTHVIVVDCASADGTADAIAAAFPQVELIASAENLGFVRANNLALRRLGFGSDAALESLPRAVYLLNPDTLTHLGATGHLYALLTAQRQIGLVGARLEYGDGSVQQSAFMFPGLRQLWVELFPTPGRLIESRFNGRYPRAWVEAGQPFNVDFVLGATMMLSREVIEATGMFDEGFFMYCEEIDWAWRIHDAGYNVLMMPSARVTHFGGASSGQARPQSIRHLWESRLRLFDKHYPRWKAVLARRMIAVGMARKARTAANQPEIAAVYAHIRRLAADEPS
ncbi:MAG: glycosyltransferase family 2 protein [Chloroflexota bacterium]|nr:glycosyltransferase family 2 protein [Chloroflexota bacterium]